MSAVESTDQERRITFLLYDCWDELAGETSLPALKNMRKQDIEPFKKNLVLLDLREDENQPILQVVGQNLQDDLDVDLTGKPQSAIPRRSMLSRVTDHYLEVLANRVPIAFEAEFVNRDGEKALYRGILLPFSDDNKKINFILGGVRWILEKDVQLDENEPSIEELMRNISEGKESAPVETEQVLAEDEQDETSDEPIKHSEKSRYANDDDKETLESAEEDNLSSDDTVNHPDSDDIIASNQNPPFDEDIILENSLDNENWEEELTLTDEEEFDPDELVLTEEDEANDLIESINEKEQASEVGFADESIEDVMEAAGDNSAFNEEIIADNSKENNQFDSNNEISKNDQSFDSGITTEESEIKEDFFASYEEDLATDELILATDEEIEASTDMGDAQEQGEAYDSPQDIADQVSLNIEDAPASFSDEMKRVLSEDISYETTSFENSPSPEAILEKVAIGEPIDYDDDILELSEADILDDETEYNKPEEVLSFEERSADALQIDTDLDADSSYEENSIEEEHIDEVVPVEDDAQHRNLTLKEFLPEHNDAEDNFGNAEVFLEETTPAAETSTLEEMVSPAAETFDSNDENDDNLSLAELMEQVLKSQNLTDEGAITSQNDVKADDISVEPSDNIAITDNEADEIFSENEITYPQSINPQIEKEAIVSEEKPRVRKSLIERAAERELQKELAAITSQPAEPKVASESSFTVEDTVKQENEPITTPLVAPIINTPSDQADAAPDQDDNGNNEQTLVELRATLKHILGYIKREDANHNRSRDSLYNILAAIYGFYYICEESPDAYNQLAGEYNLKVQQRAPFTPVLKMCLGNDYDKTRLTEYAATLTLARHLEIEEDDFPEFIKNFPGGIKGCVKDLREIRKQGTLNTGTPRKNHAINEAKEALSQIPPIGSFKLKKIIVGDNDKDFCLLLAKRNGHIIDVLKILDDKYTKLDPIIKRAAFIKGNGNAGK